jgi:hypothetical protein
MVRAYMARPGEPRESLRRVHEQTFEARFGAICDLPVTSSDPRVRAV